MARSNRGRNVRRVAGVPDMASRLTKAMWLVASQMTLWVIIILGYYLSQHPSKVAEAVAAISAKLPAVKKLLEWLVTSVDQFVGLSMATATTLVYCPSRYVVVACVLLLFLIRVLLSVAPFLDYAIGTMALALLYKTTGRVQVAAGLVIIGTILFGLWGSSLLRQ